MTGAKRRRAIHDCVMVTPVGPLGIRVGSRGVSAIDFMAPGTKPRPGDEARVGDTVGQLTAYFEDPSFEFSLQVDLVGTPFQQKVWHALRTIAPGCPSTYGELARRLGSSARAVGGACRANPVSIIVPCHRVVAATGLGGYGGFTRGRRFDIKPWLLRHEGYDLDGA